jgi:hypothetical protein
MAGAFTKLLLAALALGVLATLLVIGVWYAGRRAGALGAAATWLAATLVFAAYMLWRSSQAGAVIGARPSMAALSAGLYVALGLSVTAFAPTAWYTWRHQQRGTGALSRTVVLRGIGIFGLGCVALLVAAFVLDLIQLSRG